MIREAIARRLPEAEVIGAPDCPLMVRWTILSGRAGKLLLHWFVPEARDPDPHDHPRSFVTFVFRGGYRDLTPSRAKDAFDVEYVYAPAFRFRRAAHAHITVAGPKGAWSLVVMGPERRAWGFFREGRWWQFREYEDRFGMAFRCENEEGR